MLRHLRDDDSGAVAIIVAVMLVAFLGFAALVVDVGHWYNVRRQLQSAADAAAIAGAMDLAKGESNATIWATVEEYAGRNVSGPLEGAEVISPTPGGLSDIEDDAVKVAVQTDSGSYFGQVFGVDALTIHAQARAKIGWVYAVHGPVPWSISVLRVTEMEATVGGATVVLSDDDDDGEWTGVAPAGSDGPVTITARNSQGYEETFADIVTVGSVPDSGTIAAVQVDGTTFTSGSGPVTVRVMLKEPLPAGYKLEVGVGNNLRDMTLANAVTNTYESGVGLPTTSDPFVRVPIRVKYGKGNYVEQVDFSVLVRRQNFILQDVDVSPIVSGDADVVQIAVRPMDFEYGNRYEMKIEGGGGTTGNYLAVDFTTLDHSQCGYAVEESPGQGGGSTYREYIVGDPDLEVHVNDIVTTLPGNMTGPTKAGIEERIPDPLLSWNDWVVDKPATPQLVIIPITEKVEDVTGRAQLKIISFASFFIEEKPASSQDPVIGRFVRYLSPGVAVGPTAPYPMANPGVYLTSENVSF